MRRFSVLEVTELHDETATVPSLILALVLAELVPALFVTVPGIPGVLVLPILVEVRLDGSLSQPSYVFGMQLEEPRVKISDTILSNCAVVVG